MADPTTEATKMKMTTQRFEGPTYIEAMTDWYCENIRLYGSGQQAVFVTA